MSLFFIFAGSYLDSSAQISIAQVLFFLGDISCGLAHLHKHGVVRK
jgi:hypothetical protein